MIKCKELNKEFATKDQLFKELVENEQNIIEVKKATIKQSDGLSISVFKESDNEEKSLSFVKDGFFYPVINTTNYFDSHGDVHFPKIWDRSIKGKQNKIFYALEHKLSLDSIIAFPKDVTVMVKTLNWSDLGRDYDGKTQALIFEIDKSKIKIGKIKELIEDKVDFENSVRMRYIKIALAINSTNPDFEKQKAVWDARIDQIANREEAEKEEYFWAIDEASIEKEGSMVLFGSNDATPIIYNKKEDTSKDTLNNESSKDTQQKTSYYSALI